MKHVVTIKVTSFIIDEMNRILADPPNDIKNGIEYAACGEFDNGIQADIKVVGVNSGKWDGEKPSCYIDPVLFDEGHEFAIGEANAETLDGEYVFYVDNDEYAVIIERSDSIAIVSNENR